MVEMKRSDEVVLSLAAQLASWRAVLVLVRTWATCTPWQRKDFPQHSVVLADYLNQSKQSVWELGSGGAVATESREVGEGRRKRRHADVDGPVATANPEPKLGLRGPTLKKKQVVKGFDWLDLRLGLQPADSVDITQDFDRERETAARGQGLSREVSYGYRLPESPPRQIIWGIPTEALRPAVERKCRPVPSEAMDPAGSPSSVRKVADTARPSSSSPSAAPVPGWRSFFCLGNGTE